MTTHHRLQSLASVLQLEDGQNYFPQPDVFVPLQQNKSNTHLHLQGYQDIGSIKPCLIFFLSRSFVLFVIHESRPS